MIPNPLRTLIIYLEQTGARKDLHWFKRMWFEIPHMAVGGILSVVALGSAYVKVTYFMDPGIGYQSRYTVMRPDDPRIPKFRKEVIEADKYQEN